MFRLLRAKISIEEEGRHHVEAEATASAQQQPQGNVLIHALKTSTRVIMLPIPGVPAVPSLL